MILALDVGNTHLRYAVMGSGAADTAFTKKMTLTQKTLEIGRGPSWSTMPRPSAHSLELYLADLQKSLAQRPQSIWIASVVPELNSPLMEHLKALFQVPVFLLNAELDLGFQSDYDLKQLGADRLASALGALALYSQVPVIVVDLGTATTVAVLAPNGRLVGGVIWPGLQTGVRALHEKTAQLPNLLVEPTESLLATDTWHAINSGSYFAHLFALKGFLAACEKTFFDGQKAVKIGTGGLAKLFENAGLFDCLDEDLIFRGLFEAAKRLGF